MLNCIKKPVMFVNKLASKDVVPIGIALLPDICILSFLMIQYSNVLKNLRLRENTPAAENPNVLSKNEVPLLKIQHIYS